MFRYTLSVIFYYVFFFHDTPTTEIYTFLHTLSLHDALPILVEEAFIARDIFGIEPGDLGAEGGFVVGIVEIGAVAPIEPVEGGDGDEADILRHVVAGQAP